ncbi:MAG: TonB-dependent receptor domain-containing protein, partial [Burkholderiaceae bacterium]
LARKNDYESRFAGVFGEWTHELGGDRRLLSGLRLDSWTADRWYLSMMNAQTYLGDASATLKSGFIRFENKFGEGGKAYVGIGVSERPMDYWEAGKGGIAAGDLVTLKPEQTAQLDAGLLWKSGKSSGSLSAFLGKTNNLILIDAVGCSTAMDTTSGEGCSSNVDATRVGVEADIRHRLPGNWSVWGSAAYVYAQNDTMNVPLAQTPPLEVKLGSDYTAGNWTMGGVLRVVARQDRIHYNYGNVVGLDRAVATPGFATVGLNGSYKPSKSSQITFGIDNLFDRNYYEHISKSDVNQSSIGYSSYDVNTAINEPGRTFWVKGQVNF